MGLNSHVYQRDFLRGGSLSWNCLEYVGASEMVMPWWFQNNDARVMEEDIIRFYRKCTAHFIAPKALHSYLHHLKVLKVSS
jgi:hypothetical protein